MCGIAGIIAADLDEVHGALPKMVAALRHRGPNDQGMVYRSLDGGYLGLGHTRLSILDLSPAGHQPMEHPETGSLLVFNGEIYNFARLRATLLAEGDHFRSCCDTEVLLHGLERWGTDCLQRLQGMFAFAWLQSGRLLLARDPLGIKPLYVAHVPGAVLFASEVRALLASGVVPRKLDRRGMAGLLAYGAVQHPFTLVQDVQSFPAGHCQWLGPHGNEQAPTAHYRFPRPQQQAEVAESVSAVRDTVRAAVADHLVSDVPLGLFLSSGLDSTVVATQARECTSHLRTFTVGFKDHSDLSETALAAETARAFGFDHVEICVNSDQALELTREWLAQLDQPSVDGLNIYLLSKVVHAAGITVALSGQGGDELFGGYPSFTEVPRLLRLRKQIRWLPVTLRRALLAAAGMGRNKVGRDKLADVAASPADLVELYLYRRRALSNRQMAQLGLSARFLGLTENFQSPKAVTECPTEVDDPAWLISLLETSFYQGNMLLRDGDACSMAHGLELRLPLLDRRVIDLVFTLPGRVRSPPGAEAKFLLREAFGAVLPPAILNQPKRGFALPVHRWMLADLRPLVQQALATLKRTDVLLPAGIDAIWASFLAEPNSPAWSRAFALVVLGSYLERSGLA